MALPTGNQISAALKSVPLFAGLDERQIGSLARHAVARRSEPGEMIFVEGDECQGLYVVFSGAIKIFKESSQGREQVLTVERSGGVVAELPVFDGGPYPASCSPIESTVLLFISKQDFRRSCREDPDLALKVLASVGARLRRLVMIIEELSFLTVRSRLAALLLDIVRRGQKAGEAVTTVPSSASTENRSDKSTVQVSLTLTQQEIAARIGTVRELVSRNLGWLQSQGIIRLDGRMLIVQDMERLEQQALTHE